MDLIAVERPIRREMREKKYAFIMADEFTIAPELATARQRLEESWENLEPDNYLKNGSRFRLRRFGLFYFLPHSEELLPISDTTYLQSGDINAYAGDIVRKFAPLEDETLTNKFLHELIKFNFRLLPVNGETTHQPWEINLHQIRTVAHPDELGEPTPEGIHRDGDDFGFVHLIDRQNAAGGRSTVYDNDRNPLTSLTLRQPMDSMLFWDSHVMHGVTPIQPRNPEKQSFRDALLIAYTLRPELERPE